MTDRFLPWALLPFYCGFLCLSSLSLSVYLSIMKVSAVIVSQSAPLTTRVGLRTEPLQDSKTSALDNSQQGIFTGRHYSGPVAFFMDLRDIIHFIHPLKAKLLTFCWKE